MHTTFRTSTFKTLLLAAVVSSTLSGCIIHVGGSSNGSSVSSVLGSLEIGEGKEVENVDSVNGDIELHDYVIAQSVETVNGDIEIGDHVSVYEAETVNGSIEIGSHFKAQANVETVNGSIEIETDSEILGSVETVNGDIKLNSAKIHGDIITVNGDMTFKPGTVIKGDVVFKERSSRRSNHKKPVLRIDNGVSIEGRISLYQPVELEIEDAQLLEKVDTLYHSH